MVEQDSNPQDHDVLASFKILSFSWQKLIGMATAKLIEREREKERKKERWKTRQRQTEKRERDRKERERE